MSALGRFHCIFVKRVRLNYVTTYHHPPPSSTTHQEPIYIHHHSPPPKKKQPPSKSQNISIYNPYMTIAFNSFFFLRKCDSPLRAEILCDKVLISSFFKFKLFTAFYDIITAKVWWSQCVRLHPKSLLPQKMHQKGIPLGNV